MIHKGGELDPVTIIFLGMILQSTKEKNLWKCYRMTYKRTLVMFRHDHLNVNVLKIVVMLIGSQRRIKNHVLQMHLNGINLSNVSTNRLFGVWIDNHLFWNEQVDHINKVRLRDCYLFLQVLLC